MEAIAKTMGETRIAIGCKKINGEYEIMVVLYVDDFEDMFGRAILEDIKSSGELHVKLVQSYE